MKRQNFYQANEAKRESKLVAGQLTKEQLHHAQKIGAICGALNEMFMVSRRSGNTPLLLDGLKEAERPAIILANTRQYGDRLSWDAARYHVNKHRRSREPNIPIGYQDLPMAVSEFRRAVDNKRATSYGMDGSGLPIAIDNSFMLEFTRDLQRALHDLTSCFTGDVTNGYTIWGRRAANKIKLRRIMKYLKGRPKPHKLGEPGTTLDDLLGMEPDWKKSLSSFPFSRSPWW